MTVLNTPNLNVPYPDTADDLSDAPTLMHEMVSVLDSLNGPVATRVIEDVLAAMPDPASTPIGTMFRAIDTGMMVIVNASNHWELLPFGQSLPPIGAIQHYAGPSDPVDPDGVKRWLICDGRNVSRATYPFLFATLGTRYGSGDGHTTFGLPNGSSRVLMTTSAPSSVGQTGGAEAVSAEITSHSHTDSGHTHPATDAAPHFHYSLKSDPLHNFFLNNFSGLVVTTSPFNGATPTPTGNFTYTGQTAVGNAFFTCSVALAALQPSGSGSTHNNMSPYLVLNHIIRVL